MSDGTKVHQDATKELGHTPGAIGHPEPGGGHDDSQTVTVDDGPPITKVDGEPGAFGHPGGEDEPHTDIMYETGESS
jgi:hypothetical protein